MGGGSTGALALISLGLAAQAFPQAVVERWGRRRQPPGWKLGLVSGVVGILGAAAIMPAARYAHGVWDKGGLTGGLAELGEYADAGFVVVGLVLGAVVGTVYAGIVVGRRAGEGLAAQAARGGGLVSLGFAAVAILGAGLELATRGELLQVLFLVPGVVWLLLASYIVYFFYALWIAWTWALGDRFAFRLSADDEA
jgi:hypothetical protein